MDDTDFCVENLRIKDLPPLEPGIAKPRRRQREFVMISQEQSNRLDKAVNFSTERVFRHLLFDMAVARQTRSTGEYRSRAKGYRTSHQDARAP